MFFFFKQKTAYEMRISDWSSDVCSSDLAQLAAAVALLLAQSRLKRAPGLAQQQHDQQDDRRAHGDQQQQQELGVGHAASVSVPVAANATLFASPVGGMSGLALRQRLRHVARLVAGSGIVMQDTLPLGIGRA